MISQLLLPIVALALVAACSRPASGPVAGDTPEGARLFLQTVNETMLRLGTASGQAAWVYSTYITPDSEALNARANQAYIEAVARYAKEATRFDHVDLSAGERRQMNLLKLSLVLVTPSDSTKAGELTRIAASMEGACTPTCG